MNDEVPGVPKTARRELRFTTTARSTKKLISIEPLYKLPAELNPNNMFQPPYSKDDSGVAAKFIDYEILFENSLSLHDTILKPFLVRLKCWQFIHLRILPMLLSGIHKIVIKISEEML
jgi:hypothetical protein